MSKQILVLGAEIKALGEKCGVSEDSDSGIADNMSVHNGPSFESSGDAPEPKDDGSIVEKYNELKQEMNGLEDAIEEAVTKENFDKAADLSGKARGICLSKHFKTFCTTLTQMVVMMTRTKRISLSHTKAY